MLHAQTIEDFTTLYQHGEGAIVSVKGTVSQVCLDSLKKTNKKVIYSTFQTHFFHVKHIPDLSNCVDIYQ